MKKRSRWQLLPKLAYAVLSVGLGASSRILAAAQTQQQVNVNSGPVIPLEEIRRPSTISSIRVSPNGKSLAMFAVVDRRGSIFLAPVSGTPRTLVYSDSKLPFTNVEWSRDGRYLIYLQDRDGDEVYHLMRLDPAKAGQTQVPTDLTPFEKVQVELLGLPPRAPGVVLIGMNKRDPSLQDAYRLHLDTGKLELAVENPGSITGFFADPQGRVLLVSSIRNDGSRELMARSTERAPWRTVFEVDNSHALDVLGLDATGHHAYLRTNRDTDTGQYRILDLATGSLTPLGAHRCGRFDSGALRFDLQSKPIAEECVAERAHVFTSDAKLNQAIDALTGEEGSVALESVADSQSAWVFYVDGPGNPGQYVLYDKKKGEMRVLFEHRPWLKGKVPIGKKYAWVNARDGLPILVYYSEPAATAGIPGPTVLVVHGGPWSRDVPFFEPEIALLVSRGYKTLQINYRGSTGFGRNHYEAAVGQFGKAMSDDLEDALDWAIKQRIADAARVCILGGSYGGYATLMALTRDNNRFVCGVEYAGASSLAVLIESFPKQWGPFMPRYWYRYVGNPGDAADRKRMLEVSPITYIDRIKRPLLIFQGANDPRTTQAQSDALVASMHSRGMPVIYLLARNEGHGFGSQETLMAVSRATELFLAEHLGGRAQAAVERYILQAQLDMQAEPK